MPTYGMSGCQRRIDAVGNSRPYIAYVRGDSRCTGSVCLGNGFTRPALLFDYSWPDLAPSTCHHRLRRQVAALLQRKLRC